MLVTNNTRFSYSNKQKISSSHIIRIVSICTEKNKIESFISENLEQRSSDESNKAWNSNESNDDNKPEEFESE